MSSWERRIKLLTLYANREASGAVTFEVRGPSELLLQAQEGLSASMPVVLSQQGIDVTANFSVRVGPDPEEASVRVARAIADPDHVWILFLNHMRDAKVEMLQPVARAISREALEAFVARERVEPYSEPCEWAAHGSWGKVFRKGGPLEWHNPPLDWQSEVHYRRVAVLVDRSEEIGRLPAV